MDAAKWQDIKEILSKTIDLPTEDRSEVLSDVADAEIRAEVLKLLSAHDNLDDFIEKPLLIERGDAEDETIDKLIGEHIGDYLIIEKIGSGGMGAVYLAERDHSDFKKKVALKLIKRGMDSEAILKRFTTERRILSSLDHPNIAQLIDGGISREGTSYFVMEYVDGKPLNKYCRENNVSLDERLNIFRQICAAVEHAHKNLVVHRDLKPTNILVTEDGIPKLLDFGISKLLSDDNSETGDTATLGKMFTPEYASPEQVLGEKVTTSADVYSLGVILYELLTQHRPFNVKGVSYEEVVKKVCRTEPPRPSETGENENQTQQDVSNTLQIPKALLRGDLDNIALKALRKEPSERYGSVHQFSEDISRFLQGFPVFARPQTVGYRFGKYFKRHRVGVYAAGLVVASLVTGASIATWQAFVANQERAKANERFQDVRQLANTIIFDHYEKIKDLPGATEARAKLLSDALEYLDKLAQDTGNDPGLQRDLIAAYRKLAEIQGSPVQGASLGDAVAARNSYLKALAVSEQLISATYATDDDRSLDGKILLELGMLFDNESTRDEQRDYTQRGLRIIEEVSRKNPNVEIHQKELANALWSWANIVRLGGDTQGAISAYNKSLNIYEGLARSSKDPKTVETTRRSAALTDKNIGTVYLLEGDYKQALSHYQKGFSYDKAKFDAAPESVSAGIDLSFSYQSLASAYLKMNDYVRAAENAEKAYALQKKVVDADPKDRFSALALFQTNSLLGDIYLKKGNLKASADRFSKCEGFAKDVMSGSGDNFEKSMVGVYLKNYGNYLLKKAEKEGNADSKRSFVTTARATFIEARNIFDKLVEQKSLDPAFIKDHLEIKAAVIQLNAKLL